MDNINKQNQSSSNDSIVTESTEYPTSRIKPTDKESNQKTKE
jgi:hypothetical protein